MRRFIVIAFFFIPAIGISDERMADVAAYIHAVWFAEEFNERCPDTSIEVPVTEVDLRKLLILVDGGNFVDEVARESTRPDINYRDDMKGLAKDSTVEGCDSEIALMMRARVKEELVLPDLIKEYQEFTGAT